MYSILANLRSGFNILNLVKPYSLGGNILADSLARTITDFLTNLAPAPIIIFLVSLLPILELRGGLLAAGFLGVDWRAAFVICVIGNVIPLPFIVMFIDKIFEILRKTPIRHIIEKMEARANKKSEALTKYRFLGLFAFVAIPLPGTGAWTGALIASIAMRMRLRDAMPPLILGVITAGVIMLFVSYVLPGIIF